MIEFKGDFRLASLSKTIVSPAKVGIEFISLKFDLLAFVPHFYNLLRTQIGLNSKSLRRELMSNHENATAFPLLKSSPFTKGTHHFEDLTKAEREEAMVREPVVSTHPLAVHEAANALENNQELQPAVHYFLGLLPNGHAIREAFRLCIKLPGKTGGIQD